MKGNLFNSIQIRRPQRNVFDMSHDVKMSLKFGYLYPCMVMETIPGDKVNISGEVMMRVMPMTAPIMHEMEYTVDYWYVPKRILWPGWDEWIFSHPGAPAHPFMTWGETDAVVGSLGDYMGLPIFPAGGDDVETISPFAFAAYQAIWNEFYRDQNLQTSINWVLANGDNTPFTQFAQLRKRAWQHDYFTSCLPFAQKTAPVDIPLGNVALKDSDVWAPAPPFFEDAFENPATDGTITADNTTLPHIESGGSPGLVQAYNPNGSLEVEPTTVSDLRRAFKLQEWRELAARVGTRIKEGLKGFFDVMSQDSRLDLPEFITSVKARINISEVLNNTGTEAAPQGSMAGHGIGYSKGRHGSYYCPEHGYIIGVMSVRPKTAYQQGIEKHWLKITDPYEHFWTQFEHIGEQAVQNREVYAFQGQEDGSEPFGYIPRYAEYKFINSRVSGQFRTTLNDWHLGRIFETPPALNSDFISCTPDAERVLAAGDEDDYLLAHCRHHVMKVSSMSKFGSPSF